MTWAKFEPGESGTGMIRVEIRIGDRHDMGQVEPAESGTGMIKPNQQKGTRPQHQAEGVFDCGLNHRPRVTDKGPTS